MTEQEQRIAIATACGWTEIHDVPYRGGMGDEGSPFGLFGTMNSSCVSQGQQVPNYLHDLNAMAGAEKVLTPQQQHEYYEVQLERVVGYGLSSIRHRNTRALVSATAAKRAEAFLRTLQLWRDDVSPGQARKGEGE